MEKDCILINNIGYNLYKLIGIEKKFLLLFTEEISLLCNFS
jgi:hypothetical protein